MYDPDRAATACALVTLGRTLELATELAQGLCVDDGDARAELLDALAIANLNILRLSESADVA
jgi:hypothetical protein